MKTRRASATLASQAPNVSITMQKNALEKTDEVYRRVIRDVKIRILASKDKRAIKIWRRWRIKFKRAVRAIRDKMGVKEDNIAKRGKNSILGLQDLCFKKFKLF